jgi:hypothetical protein
LQIKTKNCQLSYSRFQTSQTGGQWYSDTSPFSIPWTMSQVSYNCATGHNCIPQTLKLRSKKFCMIVSGFLQFLFLFSFLFYFSTATFQSANLPLHSLIISAGKSCSKGRLSTIDLLNKKGCFVKTKNTISVLKEFI